MSNETVEAQVRQIAADIFNLPLPRVTRQTSPESVENWDSLQHLNFVLALEAAFGLPVGLSDHTPGFHVSVAAVARGAVMIEKHFTLDRSLPGPDHKASLEPGELAAMIEAVLIK